MGLLDRKTALITGAGRGIGKAIAVTFVNHGAKVILGDINQPLVDILAEEINQRLPASALAVYLDITDSKSISSVIRKSINVFGGLNILVNNAGIHCSHPFLDFPVEDFSKVFDVNVRGTFICSQFVARQMVLQKKGGCIINIASASGKKADPGGTAYNSSKSAIIGLTRVMALELGEHSIRVNCILPGATDTEMLKDVFASEPGLRKKLEARTPLRKMAVPEDQANAALFLASDLASHITGEQLVVSGGEFMET